MATKKKIQEKVTEAVTEHVQEKVAELKETATQQTVWYKRVGYYVAAVIGAGVLQAINLYGSDVMNYISATLSGLFGF